MRSKWMVLVTVLLVLVLALAACGGDDDGGDNNDNDADDTTQTPTGDATVESGDATESSGFNPGAASFDLGANLGGEDSGLPGCSDPDDDACPAALVMDLDGEVSAGGVTINYPARYFDALTGTQSPDALIQIVPSENNRYSETAVFSVILTESVDIDEMISRMVEPDIAEWSTDTLTGKIAVSKDAEQDPPVATTIGAFETEDGRGVVITLGTTGKYGWDLWAKVYASMLDSIVVDPAE